MSNESSEQVALDLGMVTHVCPCGCDTWKILVSFEEYEIASYSLDMYCIECGNKAIAPTVLDDPDYEEY